MGLEVKAQYRGGLNQLVRYMREADNGRWHR